MNFLKHKTTWIAWELWIFKWGVFTAGILGGYYLRSYIATYLDWVWAMSMLCCLIAAYFWYTKKKS